MSRIAAFWLLATYVASGMGLLLTTSFLVGKGSACPYEIGSPGLYGLKAPPARVAAVMGSAFAASVATSYFLKKYNVRIWKRKLWTVPQIYNAKPHVVGAIHNLRFCR